MTVERRYALIGHVHDGGGGVSDHGALTGLGDDDHTQYLNASRHAAVDAADHGSGAATANKVLTADGAGNADWAQPDHGNLAGLGDDDHTQYLNTSRHAAIDAADHGSGAAAVNKVLAADGAGNASWLEVPRIRCGAYFVSTSGALATSATPVRVTFDKACTIKRVVLLADVSGNVTVELKKSTGAGYSGPTSGSSIVASDPPTLSSAIRQDKTTFTGWTTAVGAGDVINISLATVSTITSLTVLIFLEETLS